MHIAFLPYDEGHVYQKTLKEKLTELKAVVSAGVRTSFFPVVRSLIEHSPDIVHLHWTNSYLLGRNWLVSMIKSVLFVFELISCRVLGVKIVWTIHNLHNHERYQYRLELFFNRIIARLADALIIHGVSCKKDLMAFYGLKNDSKIFVVNQGNYVSAYKNMVSRDEARGRLGIGKDEKVFLFFGNVRRYKGVLELVRDFKRTEGANLRLLIAGKPYDEETRRALEDSVREDFRIKTFLEFVPDDDVQIYMSASDAVVLPYLEITTSAVVLLALSFGKPLIAPSLGYIMEIVDSEGSIIYDSGDPAGLYSSMQIALRSDLAAMGRHNLERAARYSWDTAARETYSVYSALVK